MIASPLALLRRAVEALRLHDPEAAADAADVVEALAEGTPPAALGLARTPRQRRDDLIGELAAVVAPGELPWRAADIVSTFARRYMASAWRLDKTKATPPEDKAKAILWRSLKCGAGFPTTARQLYTIIARGNERDDIAA